jgi:SAM-dependent methyltransferase
VIRAVVIDIGGVLEIAPDLGAAPMWEERLMPGDGDLQAGTRSLRARGRGGLCGGRRDSVGDVCEPIAETRQTYDLITAEYARRNAATWPHLANHISELGASLPPGSVVADVGCGPGRDITLLREQGFRVIGIDLSLGQLRTSGLPGVAQADMRQLPLRTGSADAIWCHAALLHIPRTAVPAVLAEFARAVRPDGELYLSVAEGDGERFEVASRYGSDRRR